MKTSERGTHSPVQMFDEKKNEKKNENKDEKS
jgi:hypothetical protein